MLKMSDINEQMKISDYVIVIIDSDKDVHIIDTFLEDTKLILPKEEAVKVAEYIIKILGE